MENISYLLDGFTKNQRRLAVRAVADSILMSARTRFALELPFALRRPLLALRREQEVFSGAKTKFNRQIQKRATGYQAL